MAYCTRCGTQNDEDATFCKNCGAPMKEGAPGGPWRHRDDRCEEDCAGEGKAPHWIWGVIVVLIGLYVIIEFGLKNIEGVPNEIKDFEFWWIIPVLIGVLILLAGLRIFTRRDYT